MGEVFETYKEGVEERVRGLEKEAVVQRERDEMVRGEARRVVGEARWLIGVGRNASKAEYLPLED